MARLSRLLDTNICIYLIRERSPAALKRFERLEVGEVGVSVITASELFYGVQKSARPEQNRAALEQFLLPLEILGFDEEATRHYGRLRAHPEEAGCAHRTARHPHSRACTEPRRHPHHQQHPRVRARAGFRSGRLDAPLSPRNGFISNVG